MKFISLFSGVGGFDLALERAGHECVYANDIDKYCKIVYDKNFCDSTNGAENGIIEKNQTGDDETRQGLEPKEGEIFNNSKLLHGKYSNSNPRKRAVSLDCRSITDVTTEEIPDHELLVGGFPCQSFSIAGKRGGFNDTRGTLFFDIARILKAKQPRLFILENVKGLLSHDSGNTFKTIITTLDELRYDLQWQVLNSKNFGVPQRRERVFIVGHLRGTPRPQVFPIREDGQEADDIQEQPHTNTLTARYEGAQATGSYIIEGEQHAQGINQINNPKHSNDRVYGTDGLSPTLRTMQGGNRQPFIADNPQIRRLTPLECQRLQGFPDNFYDGIEISDTQKYKQMGNAVTVNVVYAVAKRLSIPTQQDQ